LAIGVHGQGLSAWKKIYPSQPPGYDLHIWGHIPLLAAVFAAFTAAAAVFTAAAAVLAAAAGGGGVQDRGW